MPFPTTMGSNGMPTGGSNGRRVRVSNSPWQGVADAATSAAKQFNDPVAMEGMNAASTAHIAIQALGEALSRVGKHTVDTVKIDPRVAAFMEGLGEYVLKAAGPTQEVGAAITKAHQPKIDRIEANDPKERRWDIQAHDGGNHTGGRRRLGRRAV